MIVFFVGIAWVPFIKARAGVDFAEIADRHQRAVDENSKSPKAHLNLGFVYLAVADMEQAESAFENVIHLAPKDTAGYYWLGGLYFLQEKYEQSIDVFQRALREFPDWGKAHAALGISHFRRHNHEAAEVAFTRAIALMLASDSPQYSVPSSPFNSESHEWNRTMEAMSPAGVSYFLGLVAFQRGRLGNAIKYWQRAIEIDATTTEAYFQLGVAFVKGKQWEAAESALREAIRLNPKMPEAHYQLAQLYFKQRKTAEATAQMSIFERFKAKSVQLQTQRDAFSQASEAAALFINLARQFVRENKYNEAILQFQKALWHNPNLAVAYNGLGYVYTMQSQLEKAFVVQRKAIELEPHTAATHAGLGLIWLKKAENSDSEKDYDRAFSAYQKAIELKPDFPEALLNMGSIAFKLSRFEQAEKAYENSCHSNQIEYRFGGYLAKFIYARESWSRRVIYISKCSRTTLISRKPTIFSELLLCRGNVWMKLLNG